MDFCRKNCEDYFVADQFRQEGRKPMQSLEQTGLPVLRLNMKREGRILASVFDFLIMYFWFITDLTA